MDADSFVFRLNPINGLINDLKQFCTDLDFREIDPKLGRYSKDSMKLRRTRKLEWYLEFELGETVY